MTSVLKGQWPEFTSGVTSLEAPACCLGGFDCRLRKETEDGGPPRLGESWQQGCWRDNCSGQPGTPAHPSCDATQDEGSCCHTIARGIQQQQERCYRAAAWVLWE